MCFQARNQVALCENAPPRRSAARGALPLRKRTLTSVHFLSSASGPASHQPVFFVIRNFVISQPFQLPVPKVLRKGWRQRAAAVYVFHGQGRYAAPRVRALGGDAHPSGGRKGGPVHGHRARELSWALPRSASHRGPGSPPPWGAEYFLRRVGGKAPIRFLTLGFLNGWSTLYLQWTGDSIIWQCQWTTIAFTIRLATQIQPNSSASSWTLTRESVLHRPIPALVCYAIPYC